jgi:epoxyqueuosine reductase
LISCTIEKMSEKRENYSRLSRFAINRGLSLFGVADIIDVREEFNLPDISKSRYDRVVVMGKRLLDGVMDEIADQPTPLYFHHYRQINFFLDRSALAVGNTIQDSGFRALPIAASQIIDWENQTAHVSHKKMGYLAGLGWIGRNNLLVNPYLGSRFRLVTVLTDMPLDADKPLGLDCGACRACIKSCPAGAIKDRPEDFDHISCYEKLKDFRRRHIVSQYICGVCVRACTPEAARAAARLKS